MSESETKQVLLYLPNLNYEIIKNISEKGGMTVNGFIKSILLDYLIDNDYIDKKCLC